MRRSKEIKNKSIENHLVFIDRISFGSSRLILDRIGQIFSNENTHQIGNK